MWSTRDGVETFQAWEVPKAKLYDASVRLVAAMAQYQSIEGYRYDFRIVITPADGQDLRSAMDQLEGKK